MPAEGTTDRAPEREPGLRYGVTPAQTVGPFLSIGLPWSDGADVVPRGTPGTIRIVGAVYDGDGHPVADAMIETWQADPDGRFTHPDDPRGPQNPSVEGFRGFGRSDTRTGDYEIHTVRPGRVPDGASGGQAPHIDVLVFARGLINHLVTRLYFPDELDANATDPVLLTVPADRRGTLIAVASGDHLRFDIHLQGTGETVFFDL